MLNIINNLKPFFEDCYRRIGVREYAKIANVSPPTASKILHNLMKKNILLREKDRNYLLFYANKDGKIFVDLSRIYWSYKLKELISFIEGKTISPALVLFGSLSKAEVKQGSDVDLAVFAHKRKLNLEKFERRLKRKVQVFWFDSVKDMKDSGLKGNILNGYLLSGRLRF